MLGLDGLRGLAVAAVVVFHLWPSVAPAGFLGVSVFFTLSGFLITRLLLAEIDRSGTVSLRRFWGRRARRLLPASLLTLLVVTIIWSVAGWFTRDSARDTVASLFQVANWQRIASDARYGASSETSPVLHFWSLAIEEQYYLVLPLAVWLLRRHRAVLGAGFVVLTVASVAYVLANRGDAVLTYYSTFARLPELVLGALLAVVAHGRTAGRGAAAAAGIAGSVAIAALGALVVTTSLGTDRYYEGGLAAVGLVSTIAVAGAAFSPPLARTLALRPLVWLGRVSYGVYLFHWPLLMACRELGVGEGVAPWLTLALTLPLAAASLQWFEDPIRERRLRRPRLQLAAIPAFGAVMALALVATSSAPGPLIDFDAAVARAEALAASRSSAEPAEPAPTAVDIAESPIDTAPAPSGTAAPSDEPSEGSGAAALIGAPPQQLRYAVYGDSTALTLSLGLGAAQDPDGLLVQVGGDGQLGCPVGRGGSMRGEVAEGFNRAAPSASVDDICDWQRWVDQVASVGGMDGAFVHSGNWDLVGRKIPELGDRWTTIGDPAYDEWLLGEMVAVSDALHAAGAERVVWATLAADWTGDPDDPRFDQFNELVARVGAQRPHVSIVDLGAWLESTGEDQRLRPDGHHYTFDADGTAAEVGERWLNEALVLAFAGDPYVGP